MYHIEDICVLESISLHIALEKIDKSGRHILLVVDDKRRLLGTITDGDIRRSILKGSNLDQSIDSIYNKNPKYCYEGGGRQAALKIMREKGIDQIPIVNAEKVVVAVESFNANLQGVKINNPVIIMAGGLGTRLKSITQHIPKALTPIGSKPILEIIINRLVSDGFSNFYISVNYKSEMIVDYFKDGSAFNANIQYLYEDKPLGTAGALSSLDADAIEFPCLVMNCDILTTINFPDLLEFHCNKGASLTVATRSIRHDVPYGVIETVKGKISTLKEKPSYKYEINAGIYIVNKEAVKLVLKDAFFDMTDLIQKALEKEMHLLAYPINSYWIDIGEMKTLERARIDYETLNL
ncbi:MAG: CBS domain-containing protein [Alphaproteobacteria bacterium]|nr:CBS domain-containing protein [Candidatus Parcubacteria bacterium]NCQ67527.1 CBS domain-containing protein [Alphaproteobacteria bacterium]